MTYNPKIKNTSKDDMSIDANIDANNVTMGEAEDGDWTDGIFAFTTETNVGTAIDKINELLKGLAPKVPSDLTTIGVLQSDITSIFSKGVNVKIGSNDDPVETDYTSRESNLVPGVGQQKQPFAKQSGQFYTRLGAFSRDVSKNYTHFTTDTAEIGDIVLNVDKEGDSNGQLVNLRPNSFRVVRGKKSTFKIYVNDQVDHYFGEIGNQTDDATSIELAHTDPLHSTVTAKIDFGEIKDGLFLNSGETFDLFQSRIAEMKIPGELTKIGHNYIKMSHQIEGEDEVVTEYLDFLVDDTTAQQEQKAIVLGSVPYTGQTYGINSTVKFLSGIQYYTGGRYLCQGQINNFSSKYYSAKDSGGLRKGTALNAPGLIVTPHFNDDHLDTTTNTYSFSVENDNAIEISHQPNSRLFALPPRVTVALENLYDNSVEDADLEVDGNVGDIMFDNFVPTSTSLIENFDDEVYRVEVNSSGENTSDTWDSQVLLETHDMVVALGQLGAQGIYTNSLTAIANSSPTQDAGLDFDNTSTQDCFYIRKFPTGVGVASGKIDINFLQNTTVARAGNDITIKDIDNVGLDILLKNGAGEWKSILLASGIRAENAYVTTEGTITNPNGTGINIVLGFDFGANAIPVPGNVYLKIVTKQNFVGTIGKITLTVG